MRGNRNSLEDGPELFTEQLEAKHGELWWYRRGAYIVTGLVAVLIWFLMIGPNAHTAKTEMVDPATSSLEHGIDTPSDAGSISKELGFKVAAPDLSQLGGKLTRVGKADFGGVSAAVMQYQFGKSQFLLYFFREPSRQFREMRTVSVGKYRFYVSSADAVSVVSWQDPRTGYCALAAKATERDLLDLAGKLTAELDRQAKPVAAPASKPKQPTAKK